MRTTVLVIDGLGIGAMPDVEETRPQDRNANTLRHIADAVGGLRLPILESLGLGNLVVADGLKSVSGRALASYGICELQHYGADTYMGHQELMGSRPSKPVKQLMFALGPVVRAVLEREGHQVAPLSAEVSCLLVDGVAVVADNMETEPGLNINVTGSLDQTSFEHLTTIGRVVRNALDVARVIVVGGQGFTVDDIRHHLKRHPEGAVGVDTPGLGVYDEHYQVRHLGKGVRIERQAPNLIHRAGYPVVLIGKAADVVECPGSARFPMVDTRRVFALTREAVNGMDAGLVVTNVQETDLAGHEQDAERWAKLLRIVDEGLEGLLRLCRRDDVLIVTADHGNDPTIGHSEHTREQTPFLLYLPGEQPIRLGRRATLADIGATVAELFGVGQTEHGTSALREIPARHWAES